MKKEDFKKLAKTVSMKFKVPVPGAKPKATSTGNVSTTGGVISYF